MQRRDVRLALSLFIGQLVLNAAWTPIFFGAQQLTLAAVDIVGLLILLLSTTAAFAHVDRVAGLLLLPYVAWVAFATTLNITIAAMN